MTVCGGRAAAGEVGYGLSSTFTINTAWHTWPGGLDRDRVGEGVSPVFAVNTRWQVWRGDFSYTGIGTGVSGLFTANTAFAELCGTGVSSVFAVDAQLPSVELVGIPWSTWVEQDRLRVTATIRNNTNCYLDVWLGASLRCDGDGDTVYYDDPPRDIHFSVPPGESTIIRYFYTDEGYSQQFAHLFETLPVGTDFQLVTRLYVDWIPVSDVTEAAADYLSIKVRDEAGNVPALAASRLIVQRYDESWAFMDERAADAGGQVTFAEEEFTPDATYGYQAYYERPNPFDGGAIGEFWAQSTAVADGVTHLVELQRAHPYVNEAQFFVGGSEVTVDQPAAVGDTVTPRIWLTHDVAAERNVSVRLLFSRDWQTVAYDRTVNVAIPLGTCVSMDFPDFMPDEAGRWYVAWKVTDSGFGKTDCSDWTAAFDAEAGPQDYIYHLTKRQVGCTPYEVTGDDWDTDFSSEAVDYASGARINVSHMIGSGGDATYRFTVPATDLVTYTRFTVRIRGRGDEAPELELGAVARQWSGVGAAEDSYETVIEAPDDPATFLAPGPESHLATFDVVVKPGAFNTYLVEWLELEAEGTYTNPLLQQFLFVTALEKSLAEAETLMELWDFGDPGNFFDRAIEGVAILGKWLQDAAPTPAAASGTGLPIDDVIFGARDTLEAMVMTAKIVHDLNGYLSGILSTFDEYLNGVTFQTGFGENNRLPSEIAVDIAEARAALANLASAFLTAGADGVLDPDEAAALAAAGADLNTVLTRLGILKTGMTDFGDGMGNFLQDMRTNDDDDLEVISTYRGALDTFAHLVKYDFEMWRWYAGTPQEYEQYASHDAEVVPEQSFLWQATDVLRDVRTKLQQQAQPTERLVNGRATLGTTGLSDVTVTATITPADLGPSTKGTVTGSDGAYSIVVPHGAEVVVEFAKPGYTFTPQAVDLGTVTTGREQNTVATAESLAVSGQITAAGIGIAGIAIEGVPGTIVTEIDGTFEVEVDYGWNGLIQPQLAGIAFSPGYRLAGPVSADLPDQDFAAVDDGFEPNDDAQHAAALGSGTHNGLFCFDPDYYVVNVPAMSDLDVTVTVGTENEELALALFDPSDALLGEVTSVNEVASILYDWTEAGTYIVRVRSPSGALLPYSLNLSVTASAPRISTQPEDRTATYGDTVTFTVVAEGSGLSYAWERNGEDLGVTTAELRLEDMAVADAGDYRCVVSNTSGSAESEEVVLTVGKATATVTLHELTQTYDGTARAVTATTVPNGLTVDITYDGGAEVPVAAGTYEVVATVVDANYAGSANAALTVGKAPQTIVFANPGDKGGTDTFALSATGGGSGNPVSFTVTTGPASIGAGNVVSFTGLGEVTLTATQPGNADFLAAPSVARTFNVTDNSDPTVPADIDEKGNLVVEGASDGTAVSLTAFSTDTPNSAITYSLIDDAGGRFVVHADTGVVSVANGLLLDFETAATHEVTVQATDPAGNTSSSSFTIDVANVAPTAVDDVASTNADAGTNGDVLGNDTDPNGPVLTVTGVNGQAGDVGVPVAGNGGGTFEIAADGTWSFDPAGAFGDLIDEESRQSAVDYTVSDGTDTGSATLTVTVAGRNDPPVVDLNGAAAGVDYAATFTEDGGGVAVIDATGLSVTDVDDTELESVTVTITNLLDGAAESLSAHTGGRGVTANYDPATGILLLTGTASRAEYQAVLRTITYNNTSQDPARTARLVTFVANDGHADSAIATCTLTVAAENDAPVITGQETLSTPEETGLTITLDDLQVTDPDNAYPAEFTLTVQDGADYNRAGNTITPAAEFNGQLTVSVVVNDGTADSNTYNLAVAVTAIADAPVITGQEVLSTPEETVLSIMFADLHVTDSDNTYPDEFTLIVQDGANYTRSGATITPVVDFNGELMVPVSVNDGGLDSNVLELTVSVTALNDAPVLDLDAETAGIDYAAAFVEDGGPVAVVDADGLKVDDVDDEQLESALVTITNLADGAAEELSAEAGDTGIAVAYDSGTGVLSLTGTAALADYQAVLRTVTYNNITQDADTADRIVEFTVDDGEIDSPLAIAVVCFLDVIELALHPGWNLLSLPFSTRENETPGDVLVDDQGTRLFAGDLWTWDAETGRYEGLAGAFVGKEGFWGYSPCSDVRTTVEIRSSFEDGALFLFQGWSLIGPVVDIPLADVEGLENAFGPIWCWDAALQVYRAVPEEGILERGRGYWIFTEIEEGCWIETGN